MFRYKILIFVTILFLMIFISGCKTNKETILNLINHETILETKIISMDGKTANVILDSNNLQNQTFFKNIMNTKLEKTDILPKIIPYWIIEIKTLNHMITIENYGTLYIKDQQEYYHISISDNDLSLINLYVSKN